MLVKTVGVRYRDLFLVSLHDSERTKPPRQTKIGKNLPKLDKIIDYGVVGPEIMRNHCFNSSNSAV